MVDLFLDEVSKVLLKENRQRLEGVYPIVGFLAGDGTQVWVGAWEHNMEELKVVEAAVEIDVVELDQVVALALGGVDGIVTEEVKNID